MNPTTIRNAILGVAVIAATLGMSTSRADAQATLTAFYDFEGGDIADTTTWEDKADASAFQDDLIMRDNPALSGDTPNASDNSAEFAGNTNLYTDAYTTDLGPGTDAFTIMFWIKARDIDQENTAIRLMSARKAPSGGGSIPNPQTWQIEGFGNNGSNGDKMDVRFHGFPDASNWFNPDATNALARADQGEDVAEWRHVVFICANSGDPGDGGAYGRTFVDGVQTGLTGTGGVNALDPDYDGTVIGNTVAQLIIGSDDLTNPGRAFTGLLDDVALFDGVVSDDAIAAIASSALAPTADLSTASPVSLTGTGSDISVGPFSEVEVFADLNGADSTTIDVYYGAADQGATTTGWDSGPVAIANVLDGEEAFGSLTGLTEATTYFFRIIATTASGDAWSQARSFTTPLEFPPPILNGLRLDDFVSLEAFMETVLEQANDADCTLMWDSVDQGAGSVPGDWANSAALGSFLMGETVPGTITGLGANETVVCRFYASNSFGADTSEAFTFTTPRDTPVLTAYYDFEGTGADRLDDPAGDFADDLTEPLLALAVSGDVSANAKGSTQSADFANDNYLRTGSFTTDLTGDPNAWTLMFWMKALSTDQSSGNTKNMGTREGRSGNRSWRFDNWGGGQTGPNFIHDNKPTSLSNSFQQRATNAGDGTWRHVAFVVSNLGSPVDGGAYLEVFVDGSSVGGDQGDDSWTGFDVSSSGRLSLGNMSGSGTTYFGKYDDVALFAGIVSDVDIAAIAAGTLSPADFLPVTGGGAITITSVSIVGTDVIVGFTGDASTEYKMTESTGLVTFADTAPLVETTTDGSGIGTMTWPVAGAANFGRVEEK